MKFGANIEKPKEKSYDELHEQAIKEFGERKLGKILPQYEHVEDIPPIELRRSKTKYIKGTPEHIKRIMEYDLCRVLNGEETITNTPVNAKLEIENDGSSKAIIVKKIIEENQDVISKRVGAFVELGMDEEEAFKKALIYIIQTQAFYNPDTIDIMIKLGDKNQIGSFAHEDTHAYFNSRIKSVRMILEWKSKRILLTLQKETKLSKRQIV